MTDTRSTRWRPLAAALLLASLSSAAGCAGAPDGAASHDEAQNEAPLSPFASGEISATYFKYPFQNWDFDDSVHDNPVSIIFISQASPMVDRVYSQVASVSLTGSGSKMTLSGVGGSRPGVTPDDPWTSHSAGRKGAFGCWGQCTSKTDIHIRTYGPDGHAGTQVYQDTFGLAPYYLIATIHFDINENTPTADFGYQDTARRLLVNQLVAAGKWRVVAVVDVQNGCNGRPDPQHMCQHDGTAWVIDIDG